MKKYTAVDGAQFTDADLERWAEEAESEEPYGGAHLGPTSPGRPAGAGGRDRPLVLRLDAARRSKLDEVARLRRTTASQVVREPVDSL